MLEVVREIKESSLEDVISKWALRVKDYGHKVCLKYGIDSPRGQAVTEECRGLVLRRSDWAVLSMPFRKFYNYGEGPAAEIDWASAVVEEKADGTMIHVSWDYDLDRWCAGTTGTAEGESEVPGDTRLNFAELFWKVLGKSRAKYLMRGLTYVFELCTPFNTIVVQHEKSFVRLLAIRELRTLKELPTASVDEVAKLMKVGRPKKYSFSSIEEIMQAADDLPHSDEGYIVTDGQMNRIKVKSPAYVLAHHMQSGLVSAFDVVDIIQKGEVDEVVAYFPGKKDLFERFQNLIETKGAELDLVKADFIKLAEDLFVAHRVFRDRHPIRKELGSVYSEMVAASGHKRLTRDFLFAMSGKLSLTGREYLMAKPTGLLLKILIECESKNSKSTVATSL